MPFCPPQVYPDATGAGEGGSRFVDRYRMPSTVRKRRKDSDYEQSQATLQSEDSWSDVMVRHRMLSSVLLRIRSNSEQLAAGGVFCRSPPLSPSVLDRQRCGGGSAGGRRGT